MSNDVVVVGAVNVDFIVAVDRRPAGGETVLAAASAVSWPGARPPAGDLAASEPAGTTR